MGTTIVGTHFAFAARGIQFLFALASISAARAGVTLSSIEPRMIKNLLGPGRVARTEDRDNAAHQLKSVSLDGKLQAVESGCMGGGRPQ